MWGIYLHILSYQDLILVQDLKKLLTAHSVVPETVLPQNGRAVTVQFGEAVFPILSSCCVGLGKLCPFSYAPFRE